MTDELHKVAAMRIVSYQQRRTNMYNRWVKPGTFWDGDLVLRRVLRNMANLANIEPSEISDYLI